MTNPPINYRTMFNPGDPSAEQTDEQIAPYLRQAKVGDEVAVRSMYAGGLNFQIMPVVGVAPKLGRPYTDDAFSFGGQAWHTKTGKNCLAPKVKARLVMPTQAVRDYLVKRPDIFAN
jgi:hypothetical protein